MNSNKKQEAGTMKDPKFTRLYEMAKKELLEDILPFWEKYDVDRKSVV